MEIISSILLLPGRSPAKQTPQGERVTFSCLSPTKAAAAQISMAFLGNVTFVEGNIQGTYTAAWNTI